MLYVNPMQTSGLGQQPLETRSETRQQEALGEMERLFAYMLLKEMRKSIDADDLFGGGQQRQFFEEMLDDVFAGEIAESGQWGIASQMSEQLRVAQMQSELSAKMDEQMMNSLIDPENSGALPLNTTQALPLVKDAPALSMPERMKPSLNLPPRQSDGLALRRRP